MSNIIIFEDYKKQAEVFGKIDTPEKLTIFKKQYENYLLNVEDQNYFELSEEKLGESITDHYQQNLAPEPWFVSHEPVMLKHFPQIFQERKILLI